jgi:hypothetical protein
MAGQFQISIQHNLVGFEDALLRAPRLVLGEIDATMGKLAGIVTERLRDATPKFTSQLTNATSPVRRTLGEWLVRTVGKRYATYVDEGAGPGGYVPLRVLRRWIRLKGIRPRVPGMTQMGLALVLQRLIAARGIRAQNYVKPVVDRTRGLAFFMTRAAAARGMAAVGALKG